MAAIDLPIGAALYLWLGWTGVLLMCGGFLLAAAVQVASRIWDEARRG